MVRGIFIGRYQSAISIPSIANPRLNPDPQPSVRCLSEELSCQVREEIPIKSGIFPKRIGRISRQYLGDNPIRNGKFSLSGG
jgi:hypothetical protein